jgi:hypothetical protein
MDAVPVFLATTPSAMDLHLMGSVKDASPFTSFTSTRRSPNEELKTRTSSWFGRPPIVKNDQTLISSQALKQEMNHELSADNPAFSFRPPGGHAWCPCLAGADEQVTRGISMPELSTIYDYMGKKLLVALTMEGKFAGEGLQNMDEDDDMLSAMARELVERNGIGEPADAVWKALNSEHQKLFPTASEPAEEVAVPELSGNVLQSDSGARVLVQELIDSSSVLIFGQRPGSGRRTRGKPPVPEQASLFG